MTSERVRFADLPPDAVLTTAQVGEWLQLRPRQVQRLGIPYLDCGTRSRRYLKSDVVAWLEAHRIAAAGGRTGLGVRCAGITP